MVYELGYPALSLDLAISVEVSDRPSTGESLSLYGRQMLSSVRPTQGKKKFASNPVKFLGKRIRE